MEWEVVGFEIVMALFLAGLIPIGIKLFNALNKILNVMNKSSDTMLIVCQSIKDINEEFSEARDRDREIQNELSHIKRSVDSDIDKRLTAIEQQVRDYIQEDRKLDIN